MADLTITAANVLAATGAPTDKSKVAGEALTAGQPTYLKTSDGKLYESLSSGLAEPAQFYGIALNNAAINQPVAVQTGGLITIGATPVIATEYVVSANAGKIAPHADLASTNYYTRIGYGYSATQINIVPNITALQVP